MNRTDYIDRYIYRDAVKENPDGFVYTFENRDIPDDPGVPESGLLHCHPDHWPRLIGLLRSGPYVQVVVGGARAVDDAAARRFPSCVRTIFAVNAITRDPRFVCVPVGLEFSGPRGGHAADIDAVRAMGITPEPGTLHCRFALSTHPSRAKTWQWAQQSDWTLVGQPYSRYRQNPLSHLDFLVEMAKCEAVLDPRGYGIDTHRRCEAFYLGRPVIRPFAVDDERPAHTCSQEQMWAGYWRERIHNTWRTIRSSGRAVATRETQPDLRRQEAAQARPALPRFARAAVRFRPVLRAATLGQASAPTAGHT